MAETRDTGSRTPSAHESRESPSSARTPRSMRRDLFGPPSQRPFMRRMQDNIDRLFGGGHDWPSLFNEGQMDWRPAIDTFQRGNEFFVRADLPGMQRKDITVEVGDEALTITGERSYDHDEERDGIYRSERGYGAFRRVVPLPVGALADSAKASFKDGVLEVRIQAPSAEVRQGRRLDISEEAAQESSRSDAEPHSRLD
jgi:HSP20 family protein